MPEQLLNCFRIDCLGDGKHPVFVETAVGNQNVQMGVITKQVPEGLYMHRFL